jgi:diadenosine tetraphosphatase ApaH/serine/threonine PP2A family protein phosphatase
VRTALISDIHSNLEALQAVLNHIEDHGVDRIFCLGDVVGYGPNPRECIDRLPSCDLYIMGNHDFALLDESYQEGFTPNARQALIWTRRALFNPSLPLVEDHVSDFFGKFNQTHRDNGVLYVHGSPRRPVEEYIFPGDVTFPAKMHALFALIERVCFVGHTHLPGIFLEELAFIPPQDVPDGFDLPADQKCIVNIGSVGQPRDGNPASCYVIFTQEGDGPGRVEFHRVAYDVEVTMAKIYRIPDLSNDLGNRLAAGR